MGVIFSVEHAGAIILMPRIKENLEKLNFLQFFGIFPCFPPKIWLYAAPGVFVKLFFLVFLIDLALKKLIKMKKNSKKPY
jgi:hypothetical protein